MRADGRAPDELRHVDIETGTSPYAEGSCIIATGNTRVLCTASVQEGVPEWRAGRGAGWVTAEYAMLPRATHTRTGRERGRPRGRTQEIQRLVGRSLRSVVDFDRLGERTVIVDCDVLQADGGTRTASITGAWVALALAGRGLVRAGEVAETPVVGRIAAVSVGIAEGVPVLDLDYPEDRDAEVDMNFVGTPDGRLVEVQGTAEGEPFSRAAMDRMTDLALEGIRALADAQAVAMEADAG